MDTNRQDALVELESELRVNLSLVGIIPLLEKTQDGRGGFMTREEKISVVAEKGDPNRVSKIIEILRKKDNDAFDRFREILKRSGNEVWEKTIREYVERATVRRAEKHLGGFEGKVRTDKVYINEPQMPDLEDHLRKMNHELCAYILQLQPEKKYTALKIYCEEYIGSLKRSNPFEHHRYPLPDDRQEMWWEIREFWNQLDVRFPAKIIIDVIKDHELSILLEEHHILIAKFSGNTLEQFHKESIGLSDDPHLTVKVKDDNPTMKMILDLQDYLVKLGVKESLFKGFTHGCVVLYFLISPASAKQLPSTLSTYLPELDSMGILTIAVPGQWEVDIATSLGKITKDMAEGRDNPPNREPGLAVKSHSGGSSMINKVVRFAFDKLQGIWAQRSQPFRILVIGETGSGKSTLINNILGKNVAKVGRTKRSETTQIACHEGIVQEIPVKIYDTPGLSDSRHNPQLEKAHLKVIQEVINKEEIAIVIFCFKMIQTRMSSGNIHTFEIFHEELKLDWKKVLIALTFADIVPHFEPEEPPAEVYQTDLEQWKDLIGEVLRENMGVAVSDKDLKIHSVTKNYKMKLPDGEEWFTPLWLSMMEVLDPRQMFSYLKIHLQNINMPEPQPTDNDIEETAETIHQLKLLEQMQKISNQQLPSAQQTPEVQQLPDSSKRPSSPTIGSRQEGPSSPTIGSRQEGPSSPTIGSRQEGPSSPTIGSRKEGPSSPTIGSIDRKGPAVQQLAVDNIIQKLDQQEVMIMYLIRVPI